MLLEGVVLGRSVIYNGIPLQKHLRVTYWGLDESSGSARLEEAKFTRGFL